MPKFIAITILAIMFSSCAGYKLGNTKHKKLAHIKNIAVPLVKDKTQEIKLAPQATNEIVKAISNDGTYRITRTENADATLSATVKTIQFEEFRSSRLDTLRAEELTMKIIVDWQLVDNAGNVLEKGNTSGSTRYFASANQRLSRDNVKMDALQAIAQKITSQISNGF